VEAWDGFGFTGWRSPDSPARVGESCARARARDPSRWATVPCSRRPGIGSGSRIWRGAGRERPPPAGPQQRDSEGQNRSGPDFRGRITLRLAARPSRTSQGPSSGPRIVAKPVGPSLRRALTSGRAFWFRSRLTRPTLHTMVGSVKERRLFVIGSYQTGRFYS